MKKATAPRRKYTTITIPSVLFDKLSDRIKDTGFSSVSDYATYILRETMADMSSRTSKDKARSGVVERLHSLGYVG